MASPGARLDQAGPARSGARSGALHGGRQAGGGDAAAGLERRLAFVEVADRRGSAAAARSPPRPRPSQRPRPAPARAPRRVGVRTMASVRASGVFPGKAAIQHAGCEVIDERSVGGDGEPARVPGSVEGRGHVASLTLRSAVSPPASSRETGSPRRASRNRPQHAAVQPPLGRHPPLPDLGQGERTVRAVIDDLRFGDVHAPCRR